MTDLSILVDDIRLEASWRDENPGLRDAVEAALPIEGEAARWGDELYMTVDIDGTPTSAQREVEVGDLAYWPAGPAICLFWGPTPASTDATPVAASPVGAFALVDDVTPLADLSGSANLRLERAR